MSWGGGFRAVVLGRWAGVVDWGSGLGQWADAVAQGGAFNKAPLVLCDMYLQSSVKSKIIW